MITKGTTVVISSTVTDYECDFLAKEQVNDLWKLVSPKGVEFFVSEDRVKNDDQYTIL